VLAKDAPERIDAAPHRVRLVTQPVELRDEQLARARGVVDDEYAERHALGEARVGWPLGAPLALRLVAVDLERRHHRDPRAFAQLALDLERPSHGTDEAIGDGEAEALA